MSPSAEASGPGDLAPADLAPADLAPADELGFDPRDAAFDDLPTPALVLDADALERNVERMNGFLDRRGMRARPHTKTHKSPEIARLQLAQSRTVGVCCARIAEAEAMTAAGVDRVLVTSPVVTSEKIERAVALCGTSNSPSGFQLVVDSALGVDRLAAALKAAGKHCRVLIDLDPGFHRTGITFGAPAVELARRIAERDTLQLDGLQMYAGTLMHMEDIAARREQAIALWGQAAATRDAIRAAGIACDTLTGGGTGTFEIDSDLGDAEITPSDLQVGSYIFMDAQYRVIASNLSEGESAPFDFFEPSLFVLVSVVSQSVPHLATVDAGFKALACDHVPEVCGFSGVRYHFAGDEHGILQLATDADTAPAPVGLGDRLALLVSHCDPTVNLHQHYVVLRNGRPEGIWPIAARGLA